jgi:hypothetical protein
MMDTAGRRSRHSWKRHAASGLAVFLLTIVSSSCGIFETSDARAFEEPRVYVHALVESAEACQELQQTTPEYNCSEVVRFCPDGTSTWSLWGGDIIWGGTYSIKGRRVASRLDQGGHRLRFVLSQEEDHLVHEEDGAVWQRADIASEDGAFPSGRCPAD